MTRTFADWLTLREPADAAARAVDLVERIRPRLTAGGAPLVVHDLGSGTGSMGRWLAPLLPGPQHWVLHDRDADLLDAAAKGMVTSAADGAPVTVTTELGDLTRLTPADLAGAGLVTASALLDMFTAVELDRVVATCVGAGVPALLTLSVTGDVVLDPADPLDTELAAAFNDHQRRTTADGRTLLGPDAAGATADAFRRHGVDVEVRRSPWRLGPERAELIAEWLTGWVDAAVEQRPELAGAARDYTRRRIDDALAGRLLVEVPHEDLLTLG